MEKFGIFELLDALSALTARQEDAPAPAPAPSPKPPALDPVFAPPAYGASGQAAPAGGSALDSFLTRHERTKEKAKK